VQPGCNAGNSNISSPFILQIHVIGWNCNILNSLRYGLCNGSPPFPLSLPLPSPSMCVSHGYLDGWSAGTGCAAFHLFTSSIYPAIISTHTHDSISQSFHLAKFIHNPSIYFRPATAATSNSSNSSNSSCCVVLGLVISQEPCTPLL